MLKNLFKNFTTQQTEGATISLEIAFTSLLIEIAKADEEYADIEQDLIMRMIKSQFNLDATAANNLHSQAIEAQAQASDLYQFSSVIADQFSYDEKMELIKDMWRIILSDGTRDPYEDMLMRRLGGLIHVEDGDIHKARLSVSS